MHLNLLFGADGRFICANTCPKSILTPSFVQENTLDCCLFFILFQTTIALSQIIFEEYPAWFIGLCALTGLLYAGFLYYRDTSLSDNSPNARRWTLPLAFFRFLVVSIIALLLLAPVIRSKFVEVIKPYIVILQDNSESMQQAFRQTDANQYAQNIEQLTNTLKQDYQVQNYTFGSQVKEAMLGRYDEKITNISEALDLVYNTYTNQNLGAVIMATDGVYNQGSNPVYFTSKLGVPVYSIALGDTTPKRDLLIEKVLHNRIAYLGDKFTARVDLSARNCRNETAVLNIYKGKGTANKVFSKSVAINKDEWVAGEDITLLAEPAGVQQYTAVLTTLKDEVNLTNNQQTFYVEVVDNRQKILILGASPHPDISAIRQALEVNKNYEITTDYISTFKGNVRDFNVAVLHGLPAKGGNTETLISQLKSANIPIFFVLSEQTDIVAFNRAQSLLQINNSGSAKPNDVRAKIDNSKFNIFTIDNKTLSTIEQLPPLKAPFGTYQMGVGAQMLFSQKVGNTPTNYPLLVYSPAADFKVAVLCGEGLFRWKFYEYKATQNAESINDLVTKSVQYLSAKSDKRKFKVSMPKSVFNENENITFDAELYNDSYQLINTPDVSLSIYNEAGKAFPFLFNKTANAYQLNAKFFPVGNYTYTAKVVYNGVEHKANGNFSVLALQLESQQTVANHRLLYGMAQQSGGEVVATDSIATLINKIKAQQSIKPMQYSSFKSQSIINLRWIFGLLALLLAIEWFMRKYLGGY